MTFSHNKFSKSNTNLKSIIKNKPNTKARSNKKLGGEVYLKKGKNSYLNNRRRGDFNGPVVRPRSPRVLIKGHQDLKAHSDCILSLVCVPDSEKNDQYYLYSTGKDKFLKKWIISQEEDPFLKKSLALDNNQSAWQMKLDKSFLLENIATYFIMIAQYFILGMKNGSIQIIDNNFTPFGQFAGHSEEINLLYNINQYLFSLDINGSLKCWDLSTLTVDNKEPSLVSSYEIKKHIMSAIVNTDTW